jgi:outer membrane protein assembly factor BamB
MNRRYCWLVVGLCLIVAVAGCGKKPTGEQTQPAATGGTAASAQGAGTAANPAAPAQGTAAAPAQGTAAGSAAEPTKSGRTNRGTQNARSAPAATSTDWPNFRGPNHDGISPAAGLNANWASKAPKVLWTASLSDRGHAGPSVADGRVYIIDHQGDKDVVRALDVNTGKDIWTYSYADTSSFNYGFARATPTFAGGKLYVLSRLGILQCLEASSGKKIWSVDLKTELGGERPKWDYAASPLIDGNKLIVCPGGKAGIAALDPGTGKTLWTGGVSGAPGYATPVKARIGGKDQYVCFSASGVWGADASGGKVLWQFAWKTQYDVNAATPLVIDDFVFITSGYGAGCAMLKIAGGSVSEVWRSKEIQSHFNTPVYLSGYIYGTSDPGNLVCLNPQNGQALWKQSGFEKGGVVAFDGAIVAVSGNKGDVVLASADHTAYRELGRVTPLTGQSWTAPIVADGKLLVRNTQTLACLDLK